MSHFCKDLKDSKYHYCIQYRETNSLRRFVQNIFEHKPLVHLNRKFHTYRSL